MKFIRIIAEPVKDFISSSKRILKKNTNDENKSLEKFSRPNMNSKKNFAIYILFAVILLLVSFALIIIPVPNMYR